MQCSVHAVQHSRGVLSETRAVLFSVGNFRREKLWSTLVTDTKIRLKSKGRTPLLGHCSHSNTVQNFSRSWLGRSAEFWKHRNEQHKQCGFKCCLVKKLPILGSCQISLNGSVFLANCTRILTIPSPKHYLNTLARTSSLGLYEQPSQSSCALLPESEFQGQGHLWGQQWVKSWPLTLLKVDFCNTSCANIQTEQSLSSG